MRTTYLTRKALGSTVAGLTVLLVLTYFSIVQAQRPAQIEITTQTISVDTTFSADRCIFRASPRIRITGGVRVLFDCTTIEVDGQAVLDAHGADGGAGGAGGPPSPDYWDSSGSGWGCDGHHDAWVAAGSAVDRGGDGAPGGPGSPGGTIELRYHTIVSNGAETTLGAVISYNVHGGRGGSGGAGGRGRRLVCGCHSSETKYGPSGSAGPTGPAGDEGRFIDSRF